MGDEFSHCLTATLFRSGVLILKKAQYYELGRAGDMSIVLPSDQVSRKHARLYWSEQRGAWLIEDLGSRNGTLVSRLAAKGPTPLKDRDLIQIGPFDLRYRRFRGDLSELLQDVSSAGLGSTVQAPVYSKAANLSGQFAGHDLIELCQFLSFNLRSGLLEIQGDSVGTRGSILFVEGKIGYAKDLEGDGIAAASRLLRAPSGMFKFFTPPPPDVMTKVPPGELHSTENLLMEICRAADEQKSEGMDATQVDPD